MGNSQRDYHVLDSAQGLEYFGSQISESPCHVEVKTRGGWEFEGATITKPLPVTPYACLLSPVLLRAAPIHEPITHLTFGNQRWLCSATHTLSFLPS